MAVHPASIHYYKRSSLGKLRPEDPEAHRGHCLPLLPSGPDGVCKPLLHRLRSSTPPQRVSLVARRDLLLGVQPRYSGLRVQGTASSPLSTATSFKPKNKKRRGWDLNPRDRNCLLALQASAFGQTQPPLH